MDGRRLRVLLRLLEILGDLLVLLEVESRFGYASDLAVLLIVIHGACTARIGCIYDGIVSATPLTGLNATSIDLHYAPSDSISVAVYYTFLVKYHTYSRLRSQEHENKRTRCHCH
jgi:hypothetical protein